MTRPFDLNFLKTNSYFTNNIHTIYPQTGAEWIRNLPTQINKLAEKWEFELAEIMPNLSYSFVARVKYQNKNAVLKIAPTEQPLARESLCLASFQYDSPLVFHFDEKENAILMEYIYPGEPLKNLVKKGLDDNATFIICDVIKKLTFQNIPTTHPFKHLSSLTNDFHILTGYLDNNLLNKAIELFNDLNSDHTNNIILHGDLHHDNILSSESNWKIIDPHGYLGDPVAEVGTMIRNPYDCFPTDKPLKNILERRLSILKDELPYDFDRIKSWCYCITVLSAAWTYKDYNKLNSSEIFLIQTLNQICL